MITALSNFRTVDYVTGQSIFLWCLLFRGTHTSRGAECRSLYRRRRRRLHRHNLLIGGFFTILRVLPAPEGSASICVPYFYVFSYFLCKGGVCLLSLFHRTMLREAQHLMADCFLLQYQSLGYSSNAIELEVMFYFSVETYNEINVMSNI